MIILSLVLTFLGRTSAIRSSPTTISALEKPTPSDSAISAIISSTRMCVSWITELPTTKPTIPPKSEFHGFIFNRLNQSKSVPPSSVIKSDDLPEATEKADISGLSSQQVIDPLKEKTKIEKKKFSGFLSNLHLPFSHKSTPATRINSSVSDLSSPSEPIPSIKTQDSESLPKKLSPPIISPKLQDSPRTQDFSHEPELPVRSSAPVRDISPKVEFHTERITTGVKDLDEMMEGGFVKN